ncbi:major capsid protein [Apis mellifera associated microvirus 51]|nr:major capsid protein [Apis mellifera associated microvirus 51]
MKRSKFSLSHYKLLTCDMGELVPIGLTEVLPGDTIQQATSALIRVSPLLAPVMHPVHVRVHHWYVPFRIIWEDWEEFITGGPDGMNASAFPMVANPTGWAEGTLADYLGIPTSSGFTYPNGVSALPFRAYAKIFNEWYRDQDLQTELPISMASGFDGTTNQTLQNVCWEKDYFTTARPWTQKGPEITIPLGTTAPVKGIGKINQSYSASGANVYETDGSGTTFYAKSRGIDTGSADTTFSVEEDPNNPGYPNIHVDLTGASAASINDLREAFALQRYEEARARYGSRYTEYLRYLGIRSSDARLQRPEYLGGGKQTIQFSEVLQTGVTTDGDDSEGVGNLKGHGIGAMRSNRYRRFFEEHGYVVSLLSVKPKTIYAQGLPRTWSRRTKEDFFQKELQHIGQQEVYNKEIKANHANQDGVFGYQDRYDEYRRMESSIAGEFRSTLDYWHMARIFATDPALNADFVKANPTKRVNAVQTNDVLWIMANHSIQARRIVAKGGGSSVF